jgi:hypothetical protein
LCGGLYFFEFVSCSAFLLSLLLLIVYCTPVHDRVDTGKVKSSVSGKNTVPVSGSPGFIVRVVMLSECFAGKHCVLALCPLVTGLHVKDGEKKRTQGRRKPPVI